MADKRDHDRVWPDVERRHDGPMTLRELQDHIDTRIRDRLSEHMESERVQMDTRFGEIKDLLKSAFPAGDPAAHRIAHEEMIGWVRARRRFLENLALHLAKGGLWAVIVVLAVAVWHYAKAKIGGP